MAGIDKTYTKSYKDYKDVLDWCKNIGTVTDDYGNKIQPYLWLYNPNLTENDFGKNRLRINKQYMIWSTNIKQDLYLIRHCPCKVVQKRMREVYLPNYIENVLNFNTKFDI